MLDVDGGEDVDAGVEEFEDVFVAFAVFAAGDVGVGEFVDDDGVGMAGDDGVNVHLLELDGAVRDDFEGDLFEVADLGEGFLAAVGFDEANDDVGALFLEEVSVAEHEEGFADAGCGPDVDAEFAGFDLFFKLEFRHGSANLYGVFVGHDGGDGEGEAEGSAGAEAAFRGDLAAVGFHEAADEGETEAGAAVRGAAEAVKDGANAVCGDAPAGVADGELDEALALFGFQVDLAARGGVAEGVGEEIVEDGADGAAVSADVGEVREGFDFDADVAGGGLVEVAVAGFDEDGVGAEILGHGDAAAAVELGDIDEVGHDVGQLFGVLDGGGDEFVLEGAEFAGVALVEGVEAAAELEEGVAELAGGDGDELALEAIGFGKAGDVFEGGDGAEEATVGVAHGGGAEAVGAFAVAEAHGQEGGFAFGGDGFLHFDGVADGSEDFFAAGGVGEGHAVVGGVAEDLDGGLVELEDVALAVGDDDGFKDGLEDRVGELELHLAAAHFGFAELAEADG